MRRVALALLVGLAAAACANPTPTVTGDPNKPVSGAGSPVVAAATVRPLSTTESVDAFLRNGQQIDLSGLLSGLESCSILDVEAFSNLLGQPLAHDESYEYGNVEPSSADRACILFAAEDPSVELLHINVLEDADQWVRWNIRNSDRRPLPTGFAQVAKLGEGGDEFTTVEFQSSGVQLIVEARNWQAGIIFEPTPLLAVLSIAELSAKQLSPKSPAPVSSVLADCARLDPFRFGEFVDGEINSFSSSSYDGGLACTGDTTAGDRVQVVAREFSTPAQAAAEVVALTNAYQATFRNPAVLDSTLADAAWLFDRVYDNEPSGASQTTLIEAYGHLDKTLFRISFRVDTSRRGVFAEALATSVDAVLSGSWPEPIATGPTLPPDSGAQIQVVTEFLGSGGNIEVAPLVRGIGSCGQLDIESFEVIAGTGLVAVDLSAATEGSPTVVECALVRSDDADVTEMIVRASSTPQGTSAWTGDVGLEELTPIDGIDDHAFWNEADGDWIQLYIEEFDARLLIELANHSYTDEINVFWVANAFAKELLAG